MRIVFFSGSKVFSVPDTLLWAVGTSRQPEAVVPWWRQPYFGFGGGFVMLCLLTGQGREESQRAQPHREKGVGQSDDALPHHERCVELS